MVRVLLIEPPVAAKGKIMRFVGGKLGVVGGKIADLIFGDSDLGPGLIRCRFCGTVYEPGVCGSCPLCRMDL